MKYQGRSRETRKNGEFFFYHYFKRKNSRVRIKISGDKIISIERKKKKVDWNPIQDPEEKLMAIEALRREIGDVYTI